MCNSICNTRSLMWYLQAKNDSTMHEPLYAHLEALLPFLWQLLARPNFQICKNLLPFIDSLLAMVDAIIFTA